MEVIKCKRFSPSISWSHAYMMTMAARAPGYEVLYTSTTLTPAQLLPVEIEFFSEDRCQERKTLLLCVGGWPAWLYIHANRWNSLYYSTHAYLVCIWMKTNRCNVLFYFLGNIWLDMVNLQRVMSYMPLLKSRIFMYISSRNIFLLKKRALC